MNGQVSMFDLGGEQEENNLKEIKYQFSEQEEMTENEKLSMEKEMLGIYISGHPLEKIKEQIKQLTNISSKELKEIDEHIKENKYDIIYFGYENVGHTENYYRISTKENSTREARLICDESFSVSSKVWNVEFLRNNNIRFKEGMYYEDELFSIKSNILSKVTTYGEFAIFKYHRNREGSVMTKPTVKKCSDWYRMVAEVTDLYEITPEEDRKYLLSFLKNESDSIPLRVENIIEALRENRKTKVLPKRNYKFIDVLNEEE